jgi:hypothetical protein
MHPTLVEEIKLDLLGEHVSDGIEVARIEARNVSGEERALGFSQSGKTNVVGLPRQFAKAGTTTMQVRP